MCPTRASASAICRRHSALRLPNRLYLLNATERVAFFRRFAIHTHLCKITRSKRYFLYRRVYIAKVVDSPFGTQSGDIGDITLAAAVMIGQLGTPADTVRYRAIMTDAHGEPFNGEDTYVLTVPAGLVHGNGYYSITLYGADNKLLIPNDKKIYDRTTYSSAQNADGTYTVTLSPSGDGLNGIPTGKPFYAILRAYVPVRGADMTVRVEKR